MTGYAYTAYCDRNKKVKIAGASIIGTLGVAINLQSHGTIFEIPNVREI
jgi:hypothetical protein